MPRRAAVLVFECAVKRVIVEPWGRLLRESLKAATQTRIGRAMKILKRTHQHRVFELDDAPEIYPLIGKARRAREIIV